MHKLLSLFALAFMAIALASCSCSSHKSDSKKSEKTVGDGTYKTYQEACSAADFEAAHKFIDTYRQEFENTYDEVVAKKRLKYDDGASTLTAAGTKYMNVVSYVYCAEAREIMANGDADAKDRLVYLFNEVPSIGQKLPEGTHVSIYDENQVHTTLYRLYTQTNNKLCDTILDLALNSGNKRLAAISLSHYMESPTLNSSTYGDVIYSNDDKQKAKERFEEAKQNGLFGEAEAASAQQPKTRTSAPAPAVKAEAEDADPDAESDEIQ